MALVWTTSRTAQMGADIDIDDNIYCEYVDTSMTAFKRKHLHNHAVRAAAATKIWTLLPLKDGCLTIARRKGQERRFNVERNVGSKIYDQQQRVLSAILNSPRDMAQPIDLILASAANFVSSVSLNETYSARYLMCYSRSEGLSISTGQPICSYLFPHRGRAAQEWQ